MKEKCLELKNYFLEMSKEHYASGSRLVVANKDEIFFDECYGMSSIERNEETTKETVYRIASISKTIAAIGLMQLVEAGKVNLDDDLSDIFNFKIRNPKYPDVKITVRMLTTQTSSILDGYDDEELDADIPEKGYNGVNGTNLECYLKDLLVPNDGPYYTPLTFADYKPGTGWTYSNFGCGIMACVIEKVSGEYFTDYMENHIFKPLGIDASFIAGKVINKDKIADMYQCYRKNTKTVYNRERFINFRYKLFPLGENYRGPAGGLYINITNLTKLLQLLLNKGTLNGVKILEEKTVEEMYQMQWFGFSNDTYKGKAIQMKVYDDPDPDFIFRGHTGGAYGVRSYFFFNLEEKLGACFITNGFLDHNVSTHAKKMFDGTLNKIANLFGKKAAKEVLISKDNIVLKERIINYISKPIDNYYPLINVADGLDILPVVDKEGNFTITKYGKSFTPNIIIKDDIHYIDLDEFLNALGLEYTKLDNDYKITTK